MDAELIVGGWRGDEAILEGGQVAGADVGWWRRYAVPVERQHNARPAATDLTDS